MKNCLKIPRMLIPEEGFEKWCVIACDQFTSDREYWRAVETVVGEAPSTLRFILPEVYLGEDDDVRIENIRNAMFEALEKGDLTKLTRGFTLVERTTKTGTRRGIVAAFDLEEYTMGKGEISLVRSSEEVVPSRLPPRIAVRRKSPLEFPHAIIFYKDKKCKVDKILRGEELEPLYECELMQGGGRLKGYFIPEDLAIDVSEAMHSRGTPCFAVADGNHSVAAAKAYWEELKPTLKGREKLSHPARYMLAEFVNLYDEAVVFHPIHRLICVIEPEVLCDYFMRNIKCVRKGNLLYPAFKGAETVAKVDELLENFVKQNGGKIDYIHGEDSLKAFVKDDSVGIVLQAIEKDDFFDRLKDGGNFPKKTFSIGEATEKRYYMEGREISYD